MIGLGRLQEVQYNSINTSALLPTFMQLNNESLSWRKEMWQSKRNSHIVFNFRPFLLPAFIGCSVKSRVCYQYCDLCETGNKIWLLFVRGWAFFPQYHSKLWWCNSLLECLTLLDQLTWQQTCTLSGQQLVCCHYFNSKHEGSFCCNQRTG